MNRPQVIGQPTTQEHFRQGLNAMADLLSPTLGPTGGYVVSETERSTKYEYLSDSSIVVRRILSLGSPHLDVGAMTMRNIVWQVGQTVGDGGATTAILTQALYNEGVRLIAAGINPARLANGLKIASDIAIDALRQQAQPASSEDELAAVARSVTADDALSAVLGEMSFLLGPDAHVIIEKYVAPYLERRYISGAHYKAEISSMYFYTDKVRKSAVMANPAVAIVDDRLTTAEEIVPLLEAAIANGSKSLVIIATNVTGDALSVLVTNNQLPKEKKKLDILAVKLKPVGDELRLAKNDISLMTGATVLDSSGGHGAAKATPEDLGDALRVEFANKAVVVVPLNTRRPSIQEEVSKLRVFFNEMAPDDDEYELMQRRLSVLSGGIGELKIGALTRTERAHRESQAGRAFKVLSAAQHNGVVAGGGAALVHCAESLREIAASGAYSGDTLAGINLLAGALSKPLEQIAVNTGTMTPSVVLHRVLEAGAPATYDAISGQVVDAYEAGILDATDTLAEVLQIAVSGAMMVLSTDTIVYHKTPEQSLTP